MVVDVYQAELHGLLLLSVVVVELHLSQQQLSVVVVLSLKVSPLRHKTHHLRRRNYLSRLRPSLRLLVLPSNTHLLLPLDVLQRGVNQQPLRISMGQDVLTLFVSRVTGIKC